MGMYLTRAIWKANILKNQSNIRSNTKTDLVFNIKNKRRKDKMRGIKLLSIVLVAICIFWVDLPAQGGIKGGINLPDFKSFKPEVLEHKNITSWQVGVFYDLLKLTPYFAIHAEVLYIEKGGEVTVMENNAESVFKYKIDYIEIPLMLKVNLMPKSFFNPYLIAGPYWAYRAKAKKTGIGLSVDFKDESKSSDFGLVGGGGLEFKIGGPYILVEFRYEHGMKNIVKALDNRIKNSSFVFNVGVGF